MSPHTKQSELNARLRDLLRERGFRPGSQVPSERELAEMLGVGRTVLRPVLQSLETEGVLTRRAGAGTFLASVPPPRVAGATIALLTPYGEILSVEGSAASGRHEDVAWLHRVASSLEKGLFGSGTHFQLLDQSPRAHDACSVKDMAREAAQSGANAVVLLHPLGKRETIACALALLHDRDVHPLIVSARTYPGMASQVYFDSGWGAYSATRHLLELGHTRIGFAGASSGHEWVQERLSGYIQALDAADIKRRASWVWIPREGERLPSAQDGIGALEQLLALPARERPTAVVAANDVVALGFLNAARKCGLSIPDDLSLIGFDNDSTAFSQGLTTMERPTETLGETVARVTLERLRAGEAVGEGAETATVTHRLKPVLIERATTGPPSVL